MDEPLLFTHSSISGHWGCFDFSATVTNAARNMDVQVSAQASAFDPFGHTPRNGLAELYGNPVGLFKERPYRLPRRRHRLQDERTFSVSPPRHRLAKSRLSPVSEGMQSGGREKRIRGEHLSAKKPLPQSCPPNVAEPPLLLLELRLRLPAFWVASCVRTFHTCMQLPTTQTSFPRHQTGVQSIPWPWTWGAKHVRGQEALLEPLWRGGRGKGERVDMRVGWTEPPDEGRVELALKERV